MKDYFTMTGLTAKETKDGDTKVFFKLETVIGPGSIMAIYKKLQSLNNQDLAVTLDVVQGKIGGVAS